MAYVTSGYWAVGYASGDVSDAAAPGFDLSGLSSFSGGAASGGAFSGSLSDEDIARIASAVLAALNATTIPVDMVKVKGQTINGSGSEADPWGP